MTQHSLIIEYIKENGSMLPAKCYGLVYKGQMLGSETSKRCRELRAKGVLRSEQEGKFERFYLLVAPMLEKSQIEANNKVKSMQPTHKPMQNFDVKAWNAQFKPALKPNPLKDYQKALF